MTFQSPLALAFAALLSGCSTTPQQTAITHSPTTPTSVLTQHQAHFLAEKLAVEKYGWVIGEAGITRSSPPHLTNGEWSWRWRRGSGGGDMEITVTFAPDGRSPDVRYEYYSGAVYIR